MDGYLLVDKPAGWTSHDVVAKVRNILKKEARKVNIYSIQDVEYNYPKLKFTTDVSSGTYIRSLAEDIGEKLGTGAFLSSLKRTKIGVFKIEDALELKEFSGKPNLYK
jgi:tRNA pseudouridine55 synthase